MDDVDQYMDALPSHVRMVLADVRFVIRSASPGAVEGISYGMPAFQYKGKYLIGYAAFDRHFSLFPTPGPIARLGEKLAAYQCSKGTIQFTDELPVSERLIAKLVSIRMAEIDDQSSSTALVL